MPAFRHFQKQPGGMSQRFPFSSVTRKSNPPLGIGAFSVRVSPLQIRSQILVPKEQSKAVQVSLNEGNIAKTN
jgi:hypothetical protein